LKERIIIKIEEFRGFSFGFGWLFMGGENVEDISNSILHHHPHLHII
jgi:hypothetical protein